MNQLTFGLDARNSESAFAFLEEKTPITLVRRLFKNPEYERISCLTRTTRDQIFGCVSLYSIKAQKIGDNHYRIHRMLIHFKFRIKRTLNRLTIITKDMSIQYQNGMFKIQSRA